LPAEVLAHRWGPLKGSASWLPSSRPPKPGVGQYCSESPTLLPGQAIFSYHHRSPRSASASRPGPSRTGSAPPVSTRHHPRFCDNRATDSLKRRQQAWLSDEPPQRACKRKPGRPLSACQVLVPAGSIRPVLASAPVRIFRLPMNPASEHEREPVAAGVGVDDASPSPPKRLP
jgi:hypothetical protein